MNKELGEAQLKKELNISLAELREYKPRGMPHQGPGRRRHL